MPRRPSLLLRCTVLAAALHGLVLAGIFHGNGQEAGRPVRAEAAAAAAANLSVRIMAAATPVAALPLTTAMPPAAVATPSPPAELPTLQVQDAIQVQYPDAPAPEGQLRLRVFAQLDAEGRVETLVSDGKTELAPGFLEVVEAALNGASLSPARLCVEVLFDEKTAAVTVQDRPARAAANAQRCLAR